MAMYTIHVSVNQSNLVFMNRTLFMMQESKATAADIKIRISEIKVLDNEEYTNICVSIVADTNISSSNKNDSTFLFSYTTYLFKWTIFYNGQF